MNIRTSPQAIAHSALHMDGHVDADATKSMSVAAAATKSMSKKARKEARRQAGEAVKDHTSREAATAAFLAQREAAEAAKAAALEEKRAAKEARLEAEQAKKRARTEKQPRTPEKRPRQPETSRADHSAESKPGDWTCQACGANVFASKSACYKCGAGRDGSGGRSAMVAAAPDSGFEDIETKCRDCGDSFTVTAGAQQFMRDKGFETLVRSRCKACTAAKKQKFGERYGAGGSGGGEAGGGATTRCFNCNKVGHVSRDCPSERKCVTCYLCGEAGHVSRDCPRAPKGNGPACFHCGEVGHLSRQCQKAGAGACFRCGKPGHMSRDCKEAPRAR